MKPKKPAAKKAAGASHADLASVRRQVPENGTSGKRDPSQSDRVIAEKARVSPTSVGSARAELEATVQIGQSDTRVGKNGVEKPAEKTIVFSGWHTIAHIVPTPHGYRDITPTPPTPDPEQPPVRVPLADAALQVLGQFRHAWRSARDQLRTREDADETSARERATRARNAAKAPRTTERMRAIQRAYKKLVDAGYDDRRARLKVERASGGKWSYKMVYNAVRALKKISG